jgi:hypothetical protein
VKHSPQPTRTSANLSGAVHQQLNMYAIAATAAGVGLLALAPSAEAKIVYTPVHKVIRPNSTFRIDLNHDGQADFAIRNIQYCDTDNTCTSFVSAIRYGANGVEGTPGTMFQAARAYALKAGARINGKHPFSGVKMAGAGQTTSGNWFNVTNRYLGLRFQIKGRTHYGWARLTVKLGDGFTATLTGYAYETVPKKPIIAGKTKGPDEIASVEPLNSTSFSALTRQPATLGLLAMGSPGLSVWRRKEVDVLRS